MQIHYFNAEGFYTHSGELPINPVSGEPFDYNPDVCTPDPLPQHNPEEERARWVEGVWVVERLPEPPEEFPEIPENTPSIEELRNIALEAVNDWRMREEQKDIVFDFDGSQWDGGLTTRQRLQPVLSLPELPEGFFWTDHLNNDVPITKEKLHQLNAAHEAALVDEGFRIHVAQRQLKAMVAGMSREDLENFNIKNYT